MMRQRSSTELQNSNYVEPQTPTLWVELCTTRVLVSFRELPGIQYGMCGMPVKTDNNYDKVVDVEHKQNCVFIKVDLIVI